MLKECPLSDEAVAADEGDYEERTFGHWANGWFSLLLVRPNTPAHKVAEEIESALDGYPVLDESDFSDREYEAAQETWKNCYNNAERLAYIRRYRSQFDFRGFADLLGCVRGNYFC